MVIVGENMEQKNLMVRKATPKDMDLLYEMINGLATYEKRPEDMTGSIKMLKYFLFEKKIAAAVIAEMDNKPIGYAIYYPTFASFAAKANIYIEDLFIKEEYRGKGFGKEFFHKLSEMLKNEGYAKLEWSCLDWNLPSIEFYKKLGAKEETGRVYFEYDPKND